MIHALSCQLVLLIAAGTQGDLVVYPPEIVLSGNDPALIVVSEANGDAIQDVTADSILDVEDDSVAVVDKGRVYPRAVGKTRLRVRTAGRSQWVPVRVDRISESHTPSFRNDVLPVLTKLGCNSGACHGAAAGQDGFGLSLFGYDPEGDYQTITRQWVGRRINKALPEESLLLKKATGSVPHTGGQRVKRGTEEYKTLRMWVEQGALNDKELPPKLEGLDIYPESISLLPESDHRMVVVANYDDGSRRDVTHLAEFNTTDSDVAHVDHSGTLHAERPGESFITARFDTLTSGQSAIVMNGEAADHWVAQPHQNTIDKIIDQKLRRRHIDPSPVCSDETFLRRLSLDLRGMLPTEEEREEFVSDESDDKRDRVIEDYLASEEFVRIAAMRWGDVLKIRSGGGVSRQGVHRYAGWIREQIQDNAPLDKWVHELVSVRGDTRNNPAAYFYQTEKDQAKQAENIAQIFLGMRLQCASCHNHPFDRWTMDDYYGFAAFIAQVGKKTGEDPREIILFDRRSGEVKHPLTSKPVPPKFLGGLEPTVGDRDRRVILADWIVDESNPYFARHMANTLWSWLFYRGIVEKPDDVRISNPPSNAALLEYLADRLTTNGYDARGLLAEICQSRTYQSSVRSDADGGRLFAGQRLRRLPAAVLHDAIVQVTGAETVFDKTPEGTGAVGLADAAISNVFLDTFGRSGRTSVCTCEAKNEPTLSQALHLVNGESVQGKIDKGNIIDDSLASGMSAHEVADALFIRCLTRKPSEAEMRDITRMINQEDPQESLTDLFWSILNSPEFSINH